MLGTALSDMKNAAPTGIGSGAIFNGSLRGDSKADATAYDPDGQGGAA